MKTGYRNESCYGSGIRDLYEIIEFEMDELENEDIPDYIKKNYGYTGRDDSSEDVISFLKENLPEHKYGLWLASKEAVKRLYDGSEENIVEVKIPNDAVIVSDLGFDGFLIATKKRLM